MRSNSRRPAKADALTAAPKPTAYMSAAPAITPAIWSAPAPATAGAGVAECEGCGEERPTRLVLQRWGDAMMITALCADCRKQAGK